jgi:hypothetical protein
VFGVEAGLAVLAVGLGRAVTGEGDDLAAGVFLSVEGAV